MLAFSMSAMSQLMDAAYCTGGDMDFGRMFDQYLHKVSGRAFGEIVAAMQGSPRERRCDLDGIVPGGIARC